MKIARILDRDILLDDEDYNCVINSKWYKTHNGTIFTIMKKNSNKYKLTLPRFIMAQYKAVIHGMVIVTENGNNDDMRKKNMAWISRQELSGRQRRGSPHKSRKNNLPPYIYKSTSDFYMVMRRDKELKKNVYYGKYDSLQDAIDEVEKLKRDGIFK